MDIDGTLIDNHQNVLPATKQAIERLQREGVIFYIATGRMLSLAKLIQKKSTMMLKSLRQTDRYTKKETIFIRSI